MNLGREIEAASIGRPRFRDYPGPPTCAILFLPFAALAAFGFLTFRATLSPGFYWFVAFCAALMLAGALITFAIWLRFGVTLSRRELGVVLNGQEIPYAELESVTVRDKHRVDETATVRALTRTILIEAAGRKVKALYVAKPGEALDALLDHIAERVAAESRPHAGKAWRVEQGTLHARGTMVPLSTISAAGIFEGDVRLWRHRDETHFFSVPYDSKNARVLLALARNRAVEAIAEPSPSESGIGRLLFGRRTTITSVLGNTLLVAFGLALAWLSVDRFLPELQTLGHGAILGIAALWILHSIYRTSARYDFHERAVVRRTLLGTRTLAYADIRAMTWRETATVLEHVIPMGTTVHASLFPSGDAAPLKIVLHRFRGADGDLEPVRTSIARHIAVHLREHLDRGEEVPWTSQATFTRDGIALRKHLIRYDEPVGIHFNDGYFMFYRDTWRKPLALLPAGDVNFYPGLALFEALTEQSVTERAVASSRRL